MPATHVLPSLCMPPEIHLDLDRESYAASRRGTAPRTKGEGQCLQPLARLDLHLPFLPMGLQWADQPCFNIAIAVLELSLLQATFPKNKQRGGMALPNIGETNGRGHTHRLESAWLL